MITQEELKSLLHYEPETGIFTYVVNKTSTVRKGNIAGCKHAQGYIIIVHKGNSYRAHRLAFLYMLGAIPNYIDHIDGIRHNNIWSNLRACTNSENLCNSKLNIRNKSGIKGVHWIRSTDNWRASINLNRKHYHIGHFATLEEAAVAVKIARENIHGMFANHG